MNRRLKPSTAGIMVAIYVAWNARDLLGAWIHSPYDRGDSVAFFLWLAPIACLWVTRSGTMRAAIDRSSAVMFSVALGLSCAGVMTDLSVLKDLALAVALAGFLPFRPAAWIWLPIAVTWMPAAGWLFSVHNPALVNTTRIIVACLSLALFTCFIPDEPVQ